MLVLLLCGVVLLPVGAAAVASRLQLTPAVAAAGRPERPSAAAGEHPAAQEGGHAAAEAEPAHEEPLWKSIARFVNFAILAGVLIYFARSPFVQYLVTRSTEIRRDLKKAAEAREAATAQMAEIDRRLASLPGELEALRTRGAQEIAAEEARIRQASETERARQLEQARAEIDRHARIAERELVQHAANLAVEIAAARIRSIIANDDQLRLVDRYLAGMSRTQELAS